MDAADDSCPAVAHAGAEACGAVARADGEQARAQPFAAWYERGYDQRL
jgi:hypothetical protein